MPRGVNTQDEGRIQGRNVVNANSSNIVEPGIVTDGLVLHVDAGNYQSYPIAGTSWYDLSESRTNGTLTGGPTYIRDGGGAISFDRTNDYINFGNILNFTSSNFTLNSVFYLANFLTNDSVGSVLFYKGEFQINGYYFQLPTTSSGEAIFVTNQSGARQVTTSTAVWNTGKWFDVAIIRNGSAGRIYVNGKDETGTVTESIINPASSTQNFMIGAYGATVRHYTGNQIAISRVYNRALTPTEVAQNFNATRSRFNI